MSAKTLDMVSLEKKAPELVNLAKSAAVSLEKANLNDHSAKVALCLDISGSMSGLFHSGQIDELVKRVLALGLNMDDDGNIDVFLFGANSHTFGEVDAENYKDTVQKVLKDYRLEAGTDYGKAIARIRQHYQDDGSLGKIPVYVMFVTDGNTSAASYAETQLKEASAEGIFWQFMAIGKKKSGWFGNLSGSDFTFLEKLDDLPGRVVDNANFFSVEHPSEPSDNELYGLLMGEYPDWLKAAKAKAII